MNSIALGLGLLISIALAAFISRPWWSKSRPSEPGIALQSNGREQQSAWLEQREALLNTLRDLEFDYSVGKITQDDYAALRHPLLIEVAEVMAQLDQTGDEISTQIEQEVLAFRQTSPGNHIEQAASGSSTCPACGWQRRPDALYCVKCGLELPPLCPECGQAKEAGDAFCRGCGIELVSTLQQQLT